MILLSNAARIDSYVQFMTVLIIFLFVLIVTYVVTKWISKFQKTQSCGTNLEVIETQRISATKYLQIVRAGEKYLVIAVCKDTVTMLTEIPKESIQFLSNENGFQTDFKDILDRMKHAAGAKEKPVDREK